MTFVDKEDGHPSMGFCNAKKFPNMFGSPVGKEEGHPPSPPAPLRPSPQPRMQTLQTPLLRSNACLDKGTWSAGRSLRDQIFFSFFC